MKLPSTRCKKCARLLFKGTVKKIQIKCPKCGCTQTVKGRAKKGVDIIRKKP